jgi:hypothetical protein
MPDPIIYNEKYYNGITLKQLRPKRNAIHTYRTEDNIIVAMMQGSRGEFPELDFVVKVLMPGVDEKPFAPKHHYWVVDLMLKIESYKVEVREIVKFYCDFYTNVEPFNNTKERAQYKLETVSEIVKKYEHINQENTLSLEYVAIVIELFCICEKRNAGAYMFKNILNNLLGYIDGDIDYLKLLISTNPGFR